MNCASSGRKGTGMKVRGKKYVWGVVIPAALLTGA